MPRKLRRLTETGMYHVIMRGNGRQILFEHDDDREIFLRYLDHMVDRHHVELIAWCLMSNHVHLVLDDPEGNLSACIHDVGSAYAGHYNRTTGHCGAVFEGRFASIPIESDEQLLSVVCYIHDNPRKAGVTDALAYVWSSYSEYVTGRSGHCNPARVLEYLGGSDAFRRYSESGDHGEYVPRVHTRLSDEEALAVAKDTLGEERLASLKAGDRHVRTLGLQALRDASLSVRQIERVTGIGRGIINRTTHPRHV